MHRLISPLQGFGTNSLHHPGRRYTLPRADLSRPLRDATPQPGRFRTLAGSTVPTASGQHTERARRSRTRTRTDPTEASDVGAGKTDQRGFLRSLGLPTNIVICRKILREHSQEQKSSCFSLGNCRIFLLSPRLQYSNHHAQQDNQGPTSPHSDFLGGGDVSCRVWSASSHSVQLYFGLSAGERMPVRRSSHGYPTFFRQSGSGKAVKKLGQAPSRAMFFQGFRRVRSEPVPFFHSLSVGIRSIRNRRAPHRPRHGVFHIPARLPSRGW
jgi:hypothetical protein